jgi:hypothetical protein
MEFSASTKANVICVAMPIGILRSAGGMAIGQIRFRAVGN